MPVRVVLDVPYAYGKDGFYYLLPDNMNEKDALGRRVLVPFGKNNHLRQGIVIGLADIEDSISYKSVERFLDWQPVFTMGQLQLAEWMAYRFVTTPWLALMNMLPSYAKKSFKYSIHKVHEVNPPSRSDLKKVFDLLPDHDLSDALSEWPIDIVESLRQGGWLHINMEINQKGHHRTSRWIRSTLKSKKALENPEIQSLLRRAEKQQELLLILLIEGPQSIRMLKNRFKQPERLAKALQNKGLADIFTEKEIRQPLADERFIDQKWHTLNDQQNAAFKRIKEYLDVASYHPFLLHGVTGSGKTEVYLHATERALQQEKKVMVLVPEISLTPQLVGRFMGRFGDAVAVWHSRLSDGERYDTWKAILQGEKHILIGVRSACFMPLDNIGLIIVDEAHDGSYKQTEPEPRYQGRLVAEKLAQIFHCPFIAGTASPGIELYYRSSIGHMTYLSLPQRPGSAALPIVHVVDLKNSYQQGTYSFFSPPLKKAITNALEKKEQILLMINRRGYAGSMVCRECGHVLLCPQCEIPMAFHKRDDILRCHYCDHIEPVPISCPVCGSHDLMSRGIGIEQAVQAFEKEFPKVSYIRVDSDTTRQKDALSNLLGDFKEGAAKVLIGTQMIAKGMDFPQVTVVGILNTDMILALPDYRTSERAFQLLLQVAGRAGRGSHCGEVFIQTYQPEHPIIQAVAKHDTQMFYEHEIRVRKEMNYPPFSHILRIIFSHEIQDVAFHAAMSMKNWMKEQHQSEEVVLLGPAMAPIEKVRQRYRVQYLIKSKNLPYLLHLGQACRSHSFPGRQNGLRVLLDIDPESML